MKKILMAALAAFVLPASAGVYLFDTEFSQSGYDCANTTYGCAALRTTAVAGGVHFEFLGLMSGSEKITGLYGNVDPYAATSATNRTGTGLGAVTGFGTGQDSFKADGDGWFDWRMDFSPSGDTFSLNDLLEFDILGVTLAQVDNGISQNGPPNKNGFHFAVHTQGLGDGGSGWFYGERVTTRITPFDVPGTVPEPGTALLALTAAALLIRTRKH